MRLAIAVAAIQESFSGIRLFSSRRARRSTAQAGATAASTDRGSRASARERVSRRRARVGPSPAARTPSRRSPASTRRSTPLTSLRRSRAGTSVIPGSVALLLRGPELPRMIPHVAGASPSVTLRRALTRTAMSETRSLSRYPAIVRAGSFEPARTIRVRRWWQGLRATEPRLDDPQALVAVDGNDTALEPRVIAPRAQAEP